MFPKLPRLETIVPGGGEAPREGVHNRFRDLDDRWKSASTGRRTTACPTYSAKRLIQQGGAGGFACRSHGQVEQIPENGYAPAREVRPDC